MRWYEDYLERRSAKLSTRKVADIPECGPLKSDKKEELPCQRNPEHFTPKYRYFTLKDI